MFKQRTGRNTGMQRRSSGSTAAHASSADKKLEDTHTTNRDSIRNTLPRMTWLQRTCCGIRRVAEGLVWSL